VSDAEWHDGLTLRRWRLRNFKSVHAADIELAPLTVVVGANSAGKSTLLQSIRVAAQAAASDSEVFPLNGEQIRVGTFDETRFSGANSTDEPIAMGGQFHLGTASYRAVPTGYSTAYPTRRRMRRPRDNPEATYLDWDLTLSGTPTNQTASTNVTGINAATFVAGELHSFLKAKSSTRPVTYSFGHQLHYDGEVFEVDGLSTDLTDVNLRGGFPQGYLYTEPLADILFWTWYEVRQAAMRANLPRGATALSRQRWLRETAASEESDPAPNTDEVVERIITDLRTVLNDAREVLGTPSAQRHLFLRLRELTDSKQWRLDSDWPRTQLVEIYERVTTALNLGDQRGPRVSALPDLLDDAIGEARDFLATRVQHLGPLRMDPQVVYRSSPTANPGFIGAKGEYTASVLETSGHQRVQIVPQPPDKKTRSRPLTLLEAVNLWAAHLGIADEFSTEDRGRLGLQLSVRPADVNLDLDLTSVGTGVSQILPVLVMCLQAPPGSLLLIEQPELHLNPAVQQRLADFLLAVAASGRQLLVETHSDYLVTRLRRRTAEDSSERTRERIAIIFAERHEGETTYTAVRPAPDGSMENWPTGFFDESAQDSQALLEALIARVEGEL
jgi:predicted ATPase